MLSAASFITFSNASAGVNADFFLSFWFFLCMNPKNLCMELFFRCRFFFFLLPCVFFPPLLDELPIPQLFQLPELEFEVEFEFQ